ncbi:MAG TPA: hypothetical protein VF367_09660 [Candidatus Limnocylindria bacterium]|jgi:hypothetical protein
MVIAALVSFAILFVAWIVAPEGAAVTTTHMIEAEPATPEAQPLAA